MRSLRIQFYVKHPQSLEDAGKYMKHFFNLLFNFDGSGRGMFEIKRSHNRLLITDCRTDKVQPQSVSETARGWMGR